MAEERGMHLQGERGQREACHREGARRGVTLPRLARACDIVWTHVSFSLLSVSVLCGGAACGPPRLYGQWNVCVVIFLDVGGPAYRRARARGANRAIADRGRTQPRHRCWP